MRRFSLAAAPGVNAGVALHQIVQRNPMGLDDGPDRECPVRRRYLDCLSRVRGVSVKG